MSRELTITEIIDRFDDAIKNGHIYACYQAQINHVTGRMVGAEALMRWNDPDAGMQSPADFIPVFEEKGLIFKADIFIFEEVCKLQRYCADNGLPIVPVSVNMSRFDIAGDRDYVSEIEKIRVKYNVPVHNIRIEITEGFAVHGTEAIASILKRLHEIGYIVEMDDFGSGYSSLNILKDLDVDVLKFDMNFLSGDVGSRGGTIIGSMMQMAKWLNTPVIAEGVETMEQADFMRSIGCCYIQGYLYAKPVDKDQFIKECTKIEHEPIVIQDMLFEDIDMGNLWRLKSIENLLFNHFSGPSCIFTYENGDVCVLRVNKKFMKELGVNLSEQDILGQSEWHKEDEDNHRKFENTIAKAIQTHEEEECETWHIVMSDQCGEDRLCLRNTVRVIGRSGNQYLIYATIRNITTEKEIYNKLAANDKKLNIASDQNNTFAWEYDISTKKMYPCSRCRRVLGFPEVMENYPEPVFENGTFPEEFADEYRRWHKEMAEGAESFEAVVPLTPDRIPFHIRYTLECDENGRPLKAYGSATQVIQGD